MSAPDVQPLLGRLEASVQEEIEAQRRLRALLADEARALRGSDLAELRAALERIGAEIDRRVARDARRKPLLAALARAFGVGRDTLTLGSIAERAGERGTRLARLREELRAAHADADAAARRAATLVRINRAALRDVVALLAGHAPDDPVPAGGLLDARV